MIESPNKGLQISCLNRGKPCEQIIISSDNIAGYDWKEHEIILNDGGVYILRNNYIVCDAFAFYLNGEKIYEGKFENAVNSEIGIECPSILISPGETPSITLDDNRIKIWYFGKNPDPRENLELKKYLCQEKLIK